jgi:hypothetical protein
MGKGWEGEASRLVEGMFARGRMQDSAQVLSVLTETAEAVV